MITKDQHIILLNQNIEVLNRYLNEVCHTMEEVFIFGFNITINQLKYFFVDYNINFDLFDPSCLMDEIRARISQVVTNQIGAAVDQTIEIDVN